MFFVKHTKQHTTDLSTVQHICYYSNTACLSSIQNVITAPYSLSVSCLTYVTAATVCLSCRINVAQSMSVIQHTYYTRSANNSFSTKTNQCLFHCNFKSIMQIPKIPYFVSGYLCSTTHFLSKPSKNMSTNPMSASPNRLVLAIYTAYGCHRDRSDSRDTHFSDICQTEDIMCGFPLPPKNIISITMHSLSWQALMQQPITCSEHHNILVFVNISWLWMWSLSYWYIALRIYSSQDYLFLPGQFHTNSSVLLLCYGFWTHILARSDYLKM